VVDAYRFTGAKVREQALLTPVRVVPDHSVRRIEDGLGGAIVLLQFHNLSAREVLLELEH